MLHCSHQELNTVQLKSTSNYSVLEMSVLGLRAILMSKLSLSQMNVLQGKPNSLLTLGQWRYLQFCLASRAGTAEDKDNEMHTRVRGSRGRNTRITSYEKVIKKDRKLFKAQMKITGIPKSKFYTPSES